MPTAQAHIPTDRASRYLAQLCKHGSQMGVRALHQPRGHGDGVPPPQVRHAEWTDTEGIIDFGWGRCRMQATDERLTLLAEADDQHHLQRIQDGITGRLERIGRRDQLTVTWQNTQPTTPPGQSNDPPPPPARKAAARRRHLGTAALAVVVALVIAVHLGLGKALLASSQRVGWVGGGVLVLVVVKVLIVGGFALHRRRPAQDNGDRR